MDFLDNRFDNRLNKWILPNYTFFLQKKYANISPNLKKNYGYRIKLFFLLEYRKHWIENRILNKKIIDRDHA